MADFISGKSVKARVQLNGSPWEIKVKSTRVKEDAVMVADNVNGENRSRLQKICNFYEVSLDCYDDGQSSQILQNWLANQANEDANAPQLPLAGGLRFSYLDGTAGGFVFQGCTLGPLDYNASGRTERNQASVTFRAQYFQQVPAA